MENENGNGTAQVDEVEQQPEVEQSGPAEPIIEAHCPNCNGPGIRKGKTIACEVCNASFRFTKEGPKVAEIGPFDDHERRIRVLEGGKVTEPTEAQPAEPAESQPADADSADDGI